MTCLGLEAALDTLTQMQRSIVWAAVATILLVTLAAFAFGYENESVRYRRAFLADPPHLDFGGGRNEDILNGQLLRVFEHDAYWELAWPKIGDLDSPSERTEVLVTLTADLVRRGLPRLSRVDLLEMNHVWRLSSSGSTRVCATLWRGEADATLPERLGLLGVHKLARLNRDAAILALTSGGAEPFDREESRKALYEGMLAIADRLGARGPRFLEIAAKGRQVSDQEACSLTRQMTRAVPRLGPELQERFLRALVSVPLHVGAN